MYETFLAYAVLLFLLGGAALARYVRHVNRLGDVAGALKLAMVNGGASGMVGDKPVRITHRWDKSAADVFAPIFLLVIPLAVVAGIATGWWWLPGLVTFVFAAAGVRGTYEVVAHTAGSFSATPISTYDDQVRSTHRSGDPRLDAVVDLRGQRLVVMSRMTDPIRRRLYRQMAEGGSVDQGRVLGVTSEWMPMGDVVAIVRRTAALAHDLDRTDDGAVDAVVALATARDEPIAVQLEATAALLAEAGDHPSVTQLRDRLFAARHPRDAMADGGVTALFALEHLGDYGLLLDAQAIEVATRDQPTRVVQAGSRARARILERAGGGAGSLMVAEEACPAGGLSAAGRSGELSLGRRDPS